MQKRGQIYILASIILIFVVFTLTTIPNKFGQERLEQSFEKLSKNYDYESSRLINSLIATGETPFEAQFRGFTVQFTSFAKTQSPNFGLLYILTFGGTTNIGNYLDTSISISGSASANLPGCYANIPATIEFEGLSLSALDLNIMDQIEAAGCTTAIVGDEIYIEIEGIEYGPFDLTTQGSKLLIVTRQEEGEQRQVFISA